ncbi:hypothetical protein MMC07_007216 [Pseudocyphellaria aurata]|nr:hypothetical protein [Pseudocyphellaria aurata]
MYGSSSVLILIAAVSACALACPTAQNCKAPSSDCDNVDITDPGSASIAGYDVANCTGDPVGEKIAAADGCPVLWHPRLYCSDKCLTFNTSAKYLGITYGNYKVLKVFPGAQCMGGIWADYTSETCVETSSFTTQKIDVIGSVQFALTDQYWQPF